MIFLYYSKCLWRVCIYVNRMRRIFCFAQTTLNPYVVVVLTFTEIANIIKNYEQKHPMNAKFFFHKRKNNDRKFEFI